MHLTKRHNKVRALILFVVISTAAFLFLEVEFFGIAGVCLVLCGSYVIGCNPGAEKLCTFTIMIIKLDHDERTLRFQILIELYTQRLALVIPIVNQNPVRPFLIIEEEEDPGRTKSIPAMGRKNAYKISYIGQCCLAACYMDITVHYHRFF